mmetsp:Transcript_20164/g.55827  ORF Transcript_20164/g.55827 Transcript_20164/m.55827 type:complete len:220 (-) Transcript_20164:520-1179(-)
MTTFGAGAAISSHKARHTGPLSPFTKDAILSATGAAAGRMVSARFGEPIAPGTYATKRRNRTSCRANRATRHLRGRWQRCGSAAGATIVARQPTPVLTRPKNAPGLTPLPPTPGPEVASITASEADQALKTPAATPALATSSQQRPRRMTARTSAQDVGSSTPPLVSKHAVLLAGWTASKHHTRQARMEEAISDSISARRRSKLLTKIAAIKPKVGAPC